MALAIMESAERSHSLESERLPAEFTAIIENMCEDADLTSRRYPFDFERLQQRLLVMVETQGKHAGRRRSVSD